jgi:hypothetical protein
MHVDRSLGVVVGQLPVVWYATREAARAGYRERLRALREAGYVRVP